MGQTTIIDEAFTDYDSFTGEIKKHTQRVTKKSKIEPTDEFIKVSRYLGVIFAYQNIPLTLVPISYLIAEKMQFKTNEVYLLKKEKEDLAKMLGVSLERVNKLILELKKYDIIRPVQGSRGHFVVNSFLFSTGSIVETRNLQAQFDFDSGNYVAKADQKNLITGETMRKAVNTKNNPQIEGQMEFPNLLEDNGENE